MKPSTKVLIPTTIVGMLSILGIIFHSEISSYVRNSYISNILLAIEIMGLFFTMVYNVFGGGMFNREMIKQFIHEHENQEITK